MSDASHIIEYNGRGFGYEQVRLNGQLVAWRRSWLWFVPKFDFPLGATPASVEVRIWPWLGIRGFKLTVGDMEVYAEGNIQWPRQFSVRTLLITMTLIAVVVGLVAAIFPLK